MHDIKKLAAAVCVVAMMALSACGSLNPVSRAETASQKTYALYGTFVVFEEQAAQIAQDSNVSLEVKRSLAAADAVAKPVMDKSVDLALTVDGIREDLAEGNSTEELLVIATENLMKWYLDAVPKVQALVAAVRGVRK